MFATTSNEGIAISLQSLVGCKQWAQHIQLPYHRKPSGQSASGFSSPFRGRGIDFEETRIYQPGDDIRTMDWRVTARTGKPHTKVYREERERPTFFLVDYNPSMFFGSKVAFKSVIAAKVAAMLAWAAAREGDRVGGLVFSGNLLRTTPLKASSQGVLPLLKSLANVSSPPETHPCENSLATALQRFRTLAKPGSLVFILSDFNGLNQQAEKQLSELSKHSDCFALWMLDPLEVAPPPPGEYPLCKILPNQKTSNEKNPIVSLNCFDKKIRAAYQEQFIQRECTLKRTLTNRGIPLSSILTSHNLVKRLQHLFVGGPRGRP